MIGPEVAKRVSARLSKARSTRNLIEQRLDECYRYALPGRSRFNSNVPGGEPEDIYDETAVVALEDFASVIHSRMTPDSTEWFTLEADSSVDPKDKAAVDRDLAEICTYLFEKVHGSNFSQEAQESYLDLGCSTGAMLLEWRDNGFLHASVPLTQSFFEAGADDGIGGMFRERRDVRAELIPAMYPAAQIDGDLGKLIAKEPDRPLTVVDAMWRRYDDQGGAQRAVVIAGGGLRQTAILDETLPGEAGLPFLGFRFSKAAGEVYGRGPIMKVMAGVRTTNLVIELMLQNAAMALVGMYQYEDDGVLNARTIRLEPGALIPHAPGSRGLQRVDTSGNEFSVAGLVLDQQRMNIKRGTYSDALADPNRTPASASEVMYRTQDLAGRISANVGRLRGEFIHPYAKRALHLLEKAGHVELPIPMSKITVTPQGPLARAVRQQAMTALMQMHSIVAQIYGPQLAAAQYEPEALIAFLRSSLGVPVAPFAVKEKAEAQVAAAAQLMATQGQPLEPAQPPNQRGMI